MTEARESKRQRKRHGNIGTRQRQTRYERELTQLNKEQRTKQTQKHKEIHILNLSPLIITNSLRRTQITVMVADPGS